MKILIVNTSDIQGGAARAAYRLHKSLLCKNVNSQILCNYKSSDDLSVHSVTDSPRRIIKAKIASYMDRYGIRKYKNKSQSLFSVGKYSSHDAMKVINEFNADIVHLHWINHGMLSIKDISKINAPVVCSLHDMWFFTGGCHYDENCKGYKNACMNCKVLNDSKFRGLSNKLLIQKIDAFSKKNNITFIGLSKWISDAARSSDLVKQAEINVVNIPNPIDINVFKPHNSLFCRNLWGLPTDKKLVLFGAMGATSDPRKGYHELEKALKFINNKNIELVIFGASAPSTEPNKNNFKTHYVGSLQDDASLVTLYNAVDVMVVPSLQENLSNAIMESLACGTPVVGFNIGGNSDLINHKKNGYLAKPFESEDLSSGISWILDNKDKESLKYYSRYKVETYFESRIIGRKYIDLYEKILSKIKVDSQHSLR